MNFNELYMHILNLSCQIVAQLSLMSINDKVIYKDWINEWIH